MKLFIALILMFSIPAFAGDDDHGCPPGHEHINSCDDDHGQGPPGEDGQDGRDGVDGQDGIDGIDGIDGRDGVDGRDGMDGIVSNKWIIETRKWQSKWSNYTAAMESIQIHLPQDQHSRLTGGISTINGQTGFGFGYAYVFDNARSVALTIGIGTSGSEQVGKVSVGFEFGGNRNQSRFDATDFAIETVRRESQTKISDSQAKISEHERIIQDLQRKLAMHEEETRQVEERCRESNERVHETCQRK